MNHPADTNPENLRVIKTARTENAINKAAKAGLRPLVRRVVRSEEITSKFAVYQNSLTGEIQVVYDFRSFPKEGFEVVVGWTRYFPEVFPNPYAAYLLPRDIVAGERVFLEDLIEDLRKRQRTCLSRYA